jgi:N12 class adenine-specific DNA methylase
VDGGDELAEITGGGNGGARTDLRLEEILSTSAVTIAEVDAILRDGGNSDTSTFRIAAFFAKGKTAEENAAFLKREFVTQYGRSTPSGKGFGFIGASGTNEHSVCAWYSERGISLAIGTTALNNVHKVTIPWEVAAERIGELYSTGQYVTPETLSDALDNEHSELAGRLWNFYRDDMRFLPEEWNSKSGGYPEDRAIIKRLLDDHDERQAILDRLEPDVNQFIYDGNNRRWHDPEQLLDDMRDVMLTPKGVPAATIETKPFIYFITQDEIDAGFTHGTPYTEGKYRVFSYFLNNSDNAERAKFLKTDYGLGGSGTRSEINGHQSYSPGDGITLTRGGHTADRIKAQANIKWPAAARRIDALIKSGQYMSRAELDSIPSYERLMLARGVNAFYYDLPEEDYPRPFAKEMDFHYPHDDEWSALTDFLNNDAQIDATLEQMRYIVENTSAEDRYFNMRNAAFEQLTAFRNGEYTLFPGVENLISPETAEERQFEPARRDNGVVISLDTDKPLLGLSEPQEPVVQLTLFDIMPQLPSVDEQREHIEEKLREEAAEVKAASVVLESDIDEVLLNISNENKARLYERFADNPRSRETVSLVKEIYGSTLPFPLPQAVKRLAELVELGLLDGIGDPYNLFDRVRDELSERGYAVSGELVEDGINEFRSRVGAGEFSDVADFIVREFLTEEPDAEYDAPQTDEFDLMREISRIKAEHNGAIVLWQVGDFYEIYGEDATVAANALNIITTVRSRDVPVPYLVAGIPRYTLEDYARRLNDAGYDLVTSSVGENGSRSVSIYPATTTIESPQEAEPVKLVQDAPAPDFDAVAQIVYDSIMADDNFAYHLRFSQSRGALRSPLNTALDEVISELKAESPDIYGEYFDDDIADNLFDYVYKTAWASRPQPEQSAEPERAEPEQEPETPQFTEITDPDVIAEIDAVFGITSEPEQPRAIETPQPVADSALVNFRIDDDHLGEGGAKTKFFNNVNAIKVSKSIESVWREYKIEGIAPPEQSTLSNYVGWGGLPQAFDPDNKDWALEYAELKDLLTPEEYEAAKASTLNAFYTPPAVIRAMWETIERLGFKRGNILEPAMGIGNFFGVIPQDLWQSKLYGVELDAITAKIAKQLYPKANIQQMGYEETEFSDAFFDLVIGNVPFGDYTVFDGRYKQGFPIHDYFFQKSLDKVRPGGIIAFITSKYTLDKKNPEARKYIAQRAELLGAVRLPNNAFLKNAGTETTMDILFLQKRDRPLDIEPDWVHLGLTEDDIPVNRYYLDNPEMVLGKMDWDKKLNDKYGTEDKTACLPIEGADLGKQLETALSLIRGQYTVDELDNLDGVDNHAIPADSNVKNFSYALITPATEPDNADGKIYAGEIGEGNLYYRENSLMYPVDLPATTLARIKGMVELRDCVNRLIELQLDEYPESAIKAQQTRLNDLYDSFIAEFGLINSTMNNRAFNADSAYYLLCSLEILDEDGELERKADMFTKRTIRQKTVIDHVDTASEALSVSLGEKSSVDMGYMSYLTGKDEQTLFAELRGVIFKTETGRYQTADEFLSGNVREKLRLYRLLADDTEIDDSLRQAYQDNVAALTAVQPKYIEAGEIDARLGAIWIDAAYIQQFMYELLNTSRQNQKIYNVYFVPQTGEWQVTARGRALMFSDVLANVTYGTSRMNAYEILYESLNLRDVRIYDYIKDADGNERRVLNKKETMVAQQKQEAIKQAFRDWLWKDPERRETLVKEYNERFNSVRPREYDGSHLMLSGISPEITMQKHQLNAVAHQLYGGNTLLAHVVGAGKTFSMIAAAMEAKRLGLSHKSLFAVPNHLTEQWAAEFLRLYPSANILVATKKDFEMRNRKKFCAKIATGDYDAVIIGHSQLEKIPMSRERQERLIREQIFEIESGIISIKKRDGDKVSVKGLERTKKSLETKLDKLLKSKKRDDVVTFEQLGVDRMYIDEAHYFKNLYLYTKMRNVAGIAQTEAQKSSDLYMKCRYMDEVTGGKGIVFATGTPVSNTMAELYTLQRYLQYDALERMSLLHFDSWASIFGETTTSLEIAPEGNGFRARTRFAKFHNLPELMQVFRCVADIQTADMLNLPVPDAEYETVLVEPSAIQKEMVQELSERAAAVQQRKVKPEVDNMLKITTDGRKIGLDQRLINPLLPDDPNSKVNVCAENIYSVWSETRADRLTQLVFCDFSTPHGRNKAIPMKEGDDGAFEPDWEEYQTMFSNVYDDIRTKLLAHGVPEHEIAFIHDADTETRKKELFAKVRQGKIRILFGSTAKMGAGTNVQDRLFVSHDLDCPWRPSDLEQRSGRIVRQGNKNKRVRILRYATNGTFDSYLWQSVQKKQEFIAQVMTSKIPARSCEDCDETALSYAEIKALCAGDPRIREKMELDNDVARLRMLKSEHDSQHYRLEDSLLKHYPQEIAAVTERIAGIERDIAAYVAQKEKCIEVVTTDGAASVTTKFPGMMIEGVTYTEKETAGKALIESCHDATSLFDKQIGEYMGFKLSIHFDSISRQLNLLLRGNMTYSIELGTDTFGNITRINNALDSLDNRLAGQRTQLENLNGQVVAAKEALEKPFPQEQELITKETRLVLLNTDLNIDNPRSTGDSDMDVLNDDGDFDEQDEKYTVSASSGDGFGQRNNYAYDDRDERRSGTYGKSAPTFVDNIRSLSERKRENPPPSAAGKSAEIEI